MAVTNDLMTVTADLTPATRINSAVTRILTAVTFDLAVATFPVRAGRADQPAFSGSRQGADSLMTRPSAGAQSGRKVGFVEAFSTTRSQRMVGE